MPNRKAAESERRHNEHQHGYEGDDRRVVAREDIDEARIHGAAPSGFCRPGKS